MTGVCVCGGGGTRVKTEMRQRLMKCALRKRVRRTRQGRIAAVKKEC